MDRCLSHLNILSNHLDRLSERSGHSFNQRSVYLSPICSSFSTPYSPLKRMSLHTQPTTTPLPMEEGQTVYGNYELVRSFTPPSSTVPIQKWRSTKTGLSVTWAGVPGPIVNGTFTVPTEIFDDTGRPHTLEHLIFLGSSSYPYKGILDNLANKSFADGTNAWTDNDHTAYTISCAGGEGFLKLLPVYIDHILYPTLTKESFVTEVHHVNEKGENAGVVYAEMQARENGSGDLMALKMQRIMYPQSNAYRSETGGLMGALRDLTVEKIKEYHSSLYLPHNLHLLITGSSCPLPSLLHTLNEIVEPYILSKTPSFPPADWKRPFLETSTKEPVEWSSEEKEEVVEFLEADESVGEVQIGFEGVKRENLIDNLAIDVLTTYLTDSPIAPLNKEFVEIPEPLCTSIDLYTSNRVAVNELAFYLSDVPAEQLDKMSGMVKKVLQNIVKEGIDMERMGMVFRREKRQTLHNLEAKPEGIIDAAVISDLLYGNPNGEDLQESHNFMRHYDELESWTSTDWSAFLDKYLASAPSITVIGKPSAALATKVETAEKERIKQQRKDLGEDGLRQKGEELKAAKAANDREIPKEILESFQIPNVNSISWIPVETAVNDGKVSKKGQVQECIAFDGENLPFFIHFSHLQSNFLTLNVYLSTADLPADLRPYASLWQDSFFSLPIKRANGSELSHEDVINQLNDQTVQYYTDYGCAGAFQDLLRIQIKVEKHQYGSTIAWIRDLIWGSTFVKDRLEVTIAKLVQELPQQKRDGSSVARSVSERMIMDEGKSTSVANGLLRQLEFLPEVATRLKDDPESVIRDLEKFREIITAPRNLRVAVSGDILNLSEPRSSWLKNFKALPKSELGAVPWSKDALSPLGKAPSKSAVLVTLPSIEGSYSNHTAKGVVGWDHPDLPSLEVTKAVLNALESYLWKYIRGAGFAYGCGVTLSIESGTVGFYVYRSPDAFKAFEEGARVIRGLADETIKLDSNIVEAAKSSLVFAYAQKEKSLSSACSLAFNNEVLKRSSSRDLLSRMQSVTKSEILGALRKYILPIFDPASSVVACTSAPGKAEEIANSFETFGYAVERRVLSGLGGDDEDSGSESGSDMSYSDESVSGSESESE
ncbi:cytoplasm protein [Phaffia rhodozyma]|uniref:Presequence protease, mitochondrial n=1 Tax=Phaffia rhodozyma TaxID=264483 RepID=A0A0F7SL97_PHARH|nr:cytoplasm protein [Phaffia rhodozyma]